MKTVPQQVLEAAAAIGARSWAPDCDAALRFRDFEPGMYMFHAHQTELAELGWMGFFNVTSSGAN